MESQAESPTNPTATWSDGATDSSHVVGRDNDLGEFEESAPVAQAPEVVKTVHVDVERSRERTRASLAIGLTVVLVVLMLTLLIGTIAGTPIETAERLGHMVLSPLFGLVGAATGFYYGGKDR